MKLDRVIISSDDNPKFLAFWPLIQRAWKQFFPKTKVWLALVSQQPIRNDGIVNYAPVDGIPISNQAKMARYFLAASFNDYKVAMTNDIDLLVLQSKYTNDLLVQR